MIGTQEGTPRRFASCASYGRMKAAFFYFSLSGKSTNVTSCSALLTSAFTGTKNTKQTRATKQLHAHTPTAWHERRVKSRQDSNYNIPINKTSSANKSLQRP